LNHPRPHSRLRLRDLPHIENGLPRIVSAQTSRGDFNMRKFILIAGFALVSVAAQAGDRSLSLGGGETTKVSAPAKATEGPRTAEVPQAAEAPKYVERPAVVEPKTETKAETPKAETSQAETPRAATSRAATSRAGRYRPAAKVEQAAVERSRIERGRPVMRRTALMSRSARQHRMRYGIRARIISALHRHGIYW